MTLHTTPPHATNPPTETQCQQYLSCYLSNFDETLQEGACQGNICPSYICPYDICPYQEYLSCQQRWKSGRFREFNSQKIFSKTRFDRKYLGRHHGIGYFATQNSSVMVNRNQALKRMQYLFVLIMYLRLNCHGDICSGNICPGNICPYQHNLSSY